MCAGRALALHTSWDQCIHFLWNSFYTLQRNNFQGTPGEDPWQAVQGPQFQERRHVSLPSRCLLLTYKKIMFLFPKCQPELNTSVPVPQPSLTPQSWRLETILGTFLHQRRKHIHSGEHASGLASGHLPGPAASPAPRSVSMNVCVVKNKTKPCGSQRS